MSRFKKLEISVEPEQVHDQQGEPALSRKSWFEQADDARRGGLYENALRMYSRSLEEDRADVKAWCGQVQMLVFLGEYPEAELWSRKAVELFPGNGDLAASCAQALIRQNKKAEALASIDKALAMPGTSGYRWTVRAEILTACRLPLASSCFEKAQQADPDWLVSTEIGLILLFYSQKSKALLYFRSAIEQAPDSFYTWHLKGQTEQKLGMLPSAKKSYQETLNLHPQHCEALKGLRELEKGGLSFWNRIRNLWS